MQKIWAAESVVFKDDYYEYWEHEAVEVGIWDNIQGLDRVIEEEDGFFADEDGYEGGIDKIEEQIY